ncbi:sugar transferase [Patulibacter sp. SYSU D01012]|uniref:sugar transferase n=1 Tax=Patulibacter sp. SYSU D01012 TaxID=2817381 RepID=UPI001B30153C|nr:sugar transferase [Patulibacter sp. SYSU D01012]
MILGDTATVAVPLFLLQALTTFLDGDGVPRLAAIGAVLIWPVVLHLYGLYPRYPRHVATSTLNEYPRIFHAALLSTLATWGWLILWGGHQLAASMFSLLAAVLVLLPLCRAGMRRAITGLVGPERLLLVGSGSATASVARTLDQRADIQVVEHVALPQQWHREGLERETSAHQLDQLVVTEHIDRVLLSTRELGDQAVGDFLHWSRRADVSLTVVPEHFDVVGVGASIDQVQGATVVSLQPPALSRTSRLLKRSLDVVGAATGIVVLLPVMVLIAVAVRLDSRGPVFFRQERIGKGGRRFRLAKFRTMVPDADAMVDRLMEQSSDPHWLQIENDPRVTRVGRVLRSTSLDELPQLYNVLVGHMSLVGPRPLSVRDDARVGGWGRGRLDITPGLTGLWQVVGRKTVPFEEMVKLDYVYVNNWSLWGDIKLLMQTLPAVIEGRGAR